MASNRERSSMFIQNTSAAGRIQVDEIDRDLDCPGSRWSIGSTGYARRGAITAGKARRAYKLHRIIGERIAGRPLLRSEEIDHINGDTLDNRRHNLRIANHRQN